MTLSPSAGATSLTIAVFQVSLIRIRLSAPCDGTGSPITMSRCMRQFGEAGPPASERSGAIVCVQSHETGTRLASSRVGLSTGDDENAPTVGQIICPVDQAEGGVRLEE